MSDEQTIVHNDSLLFPMIIVGLETSTLNGAGDDMHDSIYS